MLPKVAEYPSCNICNIYDEFDNFQRKTSDQLVSMIDFDMQRTLCLSAVSITWFDAHSFRDIWCCS